MPPLIVIGIVGAGGNTQTNLDRDGWRDGSWDSRNDQPAGVSPSPCRNIRAAGLLADDTGLVDVDVDVDMARTLEMRRKEDDRIRSFDFDFARRWNTDVTRLYIVPVFYAL